MMGNKDSTCDLVLPYCTLKIPLKMRSLLYHINSREGKSNFTFYSANDFLVHLTLLFFCLPWSAEHSLLIAKLCLQHWFRIYLEKPDKVECNFTQILKIKQLDMTISWTQKTTKVQSFSQMGSGLNSSLILKWTLTNRNYFPVVSGAFLAVTDYCQRPKSLPGTAAVLCQCCAQFHHFLVHCVACFHTSKGVFLC